MSYHELTKIAAEEIFQSIMAISAPESQKELAAADKRIRTWLVEKSEEIFQKATKGFCRADFDRILGLSNDEGLSKKHSVQMNDMIEPARECECGTPGCNLHDRKPKEAPMSERVWCGCKEWEKLIPGERWKFCPICGAPRPEETRKALREIFAEIFDRKGLGRPPILIAELEQAALDAVLEVIQNTPGIHGQKDWIGRNDLINELEALRVGK